MNTPQSLTQAELDDAYHLAYFECEEAAIKAIRRVMVWADQRAERDLLINCVAEAMHQVEIDHLGPERYDALMRRLMSRKAQGCSQ